MTPEEHIQKLEKDVNEIKESLSTLIELVTEMNKGLYGDIKNKHVGVIEKQAEMQREINDLQEELVELNRKILEKDISTSAKRSLKEEAATWAQKIVGWAVQAIVIYSILKGAVGVDSLLKL